MSTRCNVIVKENDGKFFQLYHHHDGYPEGVGADLEEYIKQMDDDCLVDGKKFLDFLCDPKRDDEYEYEGTNICPHRDIEYLYYIDLQEQFIYCYSISILRYSGSMLKYLINQIKNNDLGNLSHVYLIYSKPFTKILNEPCTTSYRAFENGNECR